MITKSVFPIHCFLILCSFKFTILKKEVITIESKAFLKKTGLVLAGAGTIFCLAVTTNTLVDTYQKSHDYDTHLAAKQALDVSKKYYNLVFYKRSCPMCRFGKQDVIKAGEKSSLTTFYVDVESEEGEKLVEKYSIKEAPSVVYVRGDMIEKYLYVTEKAGSYQVNKEVLEKFKDNPEHIRIGE